MSALDGAGRQGRHPAHRGRRPVGRSRRARHVDPRADRHAQRHARRQPRLRGLVSRSCRRRPVYVHMAVKPGDSVTASVTTSGDGNFTLFIRNNTTARRLLYPPAAAPAPSSSRPRSWPRRRPPSRGRRRCPTSARSRFTNARVNGRPIGTFSWDRLSMSSGTPQADDLGAGPRRRQLLGDLEARVDPSPHACVRRRRQRTKHPPSVGA